MHLHDIPEDKEIKNFLTSNQSFLFYANICFIYLRVFPRKISQLVSQGADEDDNVVSVHYNLKCRIQLTHDK